LSLTGIFISLLGSLQLDLLMKVVLSERFFFLSLALSFGSLLLILVLIKMLELLAIGFYTG
jgi:hypothetical protein